MYVCNISKHKLALTEKKLAAVIVEKCKSKNIGKRSHQKKIPREVFPPNIAYRKYFAERKRIVEETGEKKNVSANIYRQAGNCGNERIVIFDKSNRTRIRAKDERAARRSALTSLPSLKWYESELKSRDKAYYRNLLRSTLTISVEDVGELGVRSAGEVLASKRIAYNAIIAENDDQLIAEADAEYGAVLFGQLTVP